MFEAIRYNLANLAHFSGRDTRSTFWFYVLFLVIIKMVISFAVSMVPGGSVAIETVQAVRGGADDAAVQQHMFASMGGVMRVAMWASVATSFAMVIMLAASFTRRLHDSNKTGWIAALVAVLQLLALVLTIGMIGDMAAFVSAMKLDDPKAIEAAAEMQQGKYALQGLLGWVPLLLVIVFGVWPSSDGENRYGPEPGHP